MTLSKPGVGYTLKAHLTDNPTVSVTSNTFNVGTEAPATLTFANQPSPQHGATVRAAWRRDDFEHRVPAG